MSKPGNFKHGLTHFSEYRAWQMLRLRCLDHKHKAYPNYGGRGITVCDRWQDNFPAFLEDMGRKPGPKYELDRIDNDQGYSKENCRWATRSENDRNRRSNRWVEFRGQRRVLVDLCQEFSVPEDTARWRLEKGWGSERTFTTPVRAKAKRGQGKTGAQHQAAARARKRVAEALVRANLVSNSERMKETA